MNFEYSSVPEITKLILLLKYKDANESWSFKD